MAPMIFSSSRRSREALKRIEIKQPPLHLRVRGNLHGLPDRRALVIGHLGTIRGV